MVLAESSTWNRKPSVSSISVCVGNSTAAEPGVNFDVGCTLSRGYRLLAISRDHIMCRLS